jgi:hypothetical protein
MKLKTYKQIIKIISRQINKKYIRFKKAKKKTTILKISNLKEKSSLCLLKVNIQKNP